MSNIPITKLSDDECKVFFKSITDKLKIENPTFFYPIYKKIIKPNEDDSINPEDLNRVIFDSKFKCKEILEKYFESDEEFNDTDTDSTVESTTDIDNNESDDSVEPIETILDRNGNDGNDLNNDVNLSDSDNDSISSSGSGDSDNDAEIDEAISNTYMATAIIEKINKATGEKICKEENIHIKKSALLDTLKVMQNEYVIPSKMNNKNISNDVLKTTMNKLNSYNNSGHVESLFLYLGNKLVESGKCPSFPYYYGCINGDDPNYHHNITDEYEAVSRTKWFKDRVNTDFDLLIIENDSDDDSENSKDSIKSSINCDDGSIEKDDNIINLNEVSSNLDNITKELSSKIDSYEDENKKNTDKDSIDKDSIDNDTLDIKCNVEAINYDFIKDMDDEDLEIELDVECNLVPDTILINNQEGGESNTDDTNDCKDSDEDSIDEDKSFIEELSDFDKDDLSIGDFDNNENNLYYVKCENMPVSLSLMEKLDGTLDDILDNNYNMSETEWFSMFFQVAFGLSIAQKYFNFVHNDLHSSNVMFKKTLKKYLYFQIDNIYYRIPTYDKITKIIDFARGTFKFGDRWIFSDQFKDDGDAHGQYDYPVDGSLKNCEHKPNPSFDLVRLGTTVIHRLDNVPNVVNFVEQITLDDFGSSLCYDEDTFDLYIDIARNCHNAVPLDIMKRPEFNKFKITKNKIPKGQYIYKY